MRLQVETYSGFKADQRPVRFELNGRGHVVIEVLDQWESPEASWFQVLAADRKSYLLRHDRGTDEWTLEAAAHGGTGR